MDQQRESGNNLYRLGEYSRAYAEYTAALCIDRDHSEYCEVVYANRAAVSMALNKFSRAIEDCTEALKRCPDMTKARLRRARAYMNAKRISDAVKDFEHVHKMSPERTDVNLELLGARRALLAQQKAERRTKQHSRQNKWQN